VATFTKWTDPANPQRTEWLLKPERGEVFVAGQEVRVTTRDGTSRMVRVAALVDVGRGAPYARPMSDRATAASAAVTAEEQAGPWGLAKAVKAKPPVEEGAEPDPEKAEAARLKAYNALDKWQRQVADLTLAPNRIFRVLAGAGSGKTTAVTALAARLLKAGLADPDDTYLITFTRLGGAELRARLGRQIPAELFDRVYTPQDPRIGTYDAFVPKLMATLSGDTNRWSMGKCISIAGKDAEGSSARGEGKGGIAGFSGEILFGERDGGYYGPKTFQTPHGGRETALADQLREQVREVKLLLKRTSGEEKNRLTDKLKVLEEQQKLLKTKNYMSTMMRILASDASPAEEAAIAAESGLALFAPFARWYRAIKRANGGWEFTDAMRAARDHLRAHPRKVNPRRLVIVDEAQDNSTLQIEFARELARGGTLVLVGDVRQAIFEWRAAAPQLYASEEALSGPDKAKVETLFLAANYRSGRRIVEAGNAVAAGKLNPHPTIKSKEVQLGGPGGAWNVGEPSVPMRRWDRNDPTSPPIEGAFMSDVEGVSGILRQIDRYMATPPVPGRPAPTYDQVAVLARRNAELGRMEVECYKAGIPVRLAGGGTYFNRVEWRFYETLLVAAMMQTERLTPGRISALIDRAIPGAGPATAEHVARQVQQGVSLPVAIATAGRDVRSKQGRAIMEALAAQLARLYPLAAAYRIEDARVRDGGDPRTPPPASRPLHRKLLTADAAQSEKWKTQTGVEWRPPGPLDDFMAPGDEGEEPTPEAAPPLHQLLWLRLLYEARVAVCYVFGYEPNGAEIGEEEREDDEDDTPDDELELDEADRRKRAAARAKARKAEARKRSAELRAKLPPEIAAEHEAARLRRPATRDADVLASGSDDAETTPMASYCDCEQVAATQPSLHHLITLTHTARRTTAQREAAEGEAHVARLPMVTLSTIHKAKGLEWDLVCVIASFGSFPIAFRKPPLSAVLRPQTVESIETIVLRGGPGKPDKPLRYRGEERRLFYVAVTRAKDVLYVTSPHFDGAGCMGRPLKASEVSAAYTGEGTDAGTASIFAALIPPEWEGDDRVDATRDYTRPGVQQRALPAAEPAAAPGVTTPLLPEEPAPEEPVRPAPAAPLLPAAPAPLLDDEADEADEADEEDEEDEEEGDKAAEEEEEEEIVPLAPPPAPVPAARKVPAKRPAPAKPAPVPLLDDNEEEEEEEESDDDDDDDDGGGDMAPVVHPLAQKMIDRVTATITSRARRTILAKDKKAGRYVVVRNAELLALLKEIGGAAEDAKLTTKTGERVYRLPIGNVGALLVYSSVKRGESNAPLDGRPLRVAVVNASDRVLGGPPIEVKPTASWRTTLGAHLHEALLRLTY